MREACHSAIGNPSTTSSVSHAGVPGANGVRTCAGPGTIAGMSILVVRRIADSSARNRQMEVLVDGAVVGRLKRKEEVSLDLPSGPHAVQARMDWVTSRVLGVERAGDRASVAVAVRVTALLRGALHPGDAIVIELEAGRLSGHQVAPVDRARYWPKAAAAAVAFVVLIWLSETTAVPSAANVVASLAVMLGAFYLATQVFRLVRKVQQDGAHHQSRGQ